jgi:hypothetical protein
MFTEAALLLKTKITALSLSNRLSDTFDAHKGHHYSASVAVLTSLEPSLFGKITRFRLNYFESALKRQFTAKGSPKTSDIEPITRVVFGLFRPDSTFN